MKIAAHSCNRIGRFSSKILKISKKLFNAICEEANGAASPNSLDGATNRAGGKNIEIHARGFLFYIFFDPLYIH